MFSGFLARRRRKIFFFVLFEHDFPLQINRFAFKMPKIFASGGSLRSIPDHAKKKGGILKVKQSDEMQSNIVLQDRQREV